jgi:hypothetical protein
MNIKQLKKAIETQDWDLVISFYEYMTGEDLQKKESKKSPVKTKPNKKPGRPAKSKLILPSDDEMKFYGGEDYEGEDNSILVKATKALNKKPKNRSYREEYKPELVSCFKCGKSYDKNKETNSVIIGEKVENYQQICNKCIKNR